MLLLAGLLPGVLRTDCCARMQQVSSSSSLSGHLSESGGYYMLLLVLFALMTVMYVIWLRRTLADIS